MMVAQQEAAVVAAHPAVAAWVESVEEEAVQHMYQQSCEPRIHGPPLCMLRAQFRRAACRMPHSYSRSEPGRQTAAPSTVLQLHMLWQQRVQL